jgi:DNA-binding MarR family transcriptional regulator
MAETDTEQLGEIPPSAKLVYFVLRKNGTMTQGEIKEESMLPSRTVRYAIGRLKETDVLTERVHLRDARKTVYEISASKKGSDVEGRSEATAADD